jgi:hypothetical protein
MKLIENPEKVIEIGDRIKVAKVFINDAPFWLEDIVNAEIVDIQTDLDGAKILVLNRIENDKEKNS